MFLSNGKVFFSQFIILFKLSRFPFCFYVSVCFGLFGCVAFLFSEVGGHFGYTVQSKLVDFPNPWFVFTSLVGVVSEVVIREK